MKERPMIFNAEMVRAILEGRKTQTQTRRIVKNQPCSSKTGPVNVRELEGGFQWYADDGDSCVFPCPFGKPGDRIWVRETFSCIGNEDGHPVDTDGNLCDRENAQRIYRASAIQKPNNYGLWTSPDGFDFEGAWTPSIHMPRWASRITLEITGVRVERLNNISEADALAEGIADGGCLNCGNPEPCGCANPAPDAKDAFAYLWQSIYGEESWFSNPWCWVIEFRRIED